ncbi:MAG: zinc ABC transporter substrate-binding protein [Bacilli bacterium]|nr:zinc ABC transporter substrate-binding protein [Bacilli bacterium]
MKKTIKYFITLLMIIVVSISTTGCGTDEMDGIEIIVTNYANEYIVNQLYSDHAKISSIYPDGVDTSTYKLSSKQKKEYAKKDIFVYNGSIETERNLAIDLLDINSNLKIIDTSYVLETDYAPEELWLNPASLLMMSQNVKNGLEEYITSTYLKKEIDEKYKTFKIDISTLDVDYRDSVSETNNKNIVVADSTLNYLEKFGLKVYCIDADASDKTIADVEELFNKKEVSYILSFKNTEMNSIAKEMLDKYSNIKTIELHKLNILTDKERENKEDYLTIMQNNLTLLNQELYQ